MRQTQAQRRLSKRQELVEVAQHACSGTPDIALVRAIVVGHGQPVARARRRVPMVAPVVGGVHQKVQRHLKHGFHFKSIGRQHKSRVKQGDHWRNHKLAACGVDRQGAKHLNKLRRQANLLLGLSQRRSHRPRIVRVSFATGKGHLARVAGQMRGSLRQQHHGPLAHDQANQDRGLGQAAV